MTLEKLHDAPPTPAPANGEESQSAPQLSLAQLHGMEVLGTLPVWVLSGMRLHRVGWRHLQSGWVVGVFKMDVLSSHQVESDETGDHT